MGETTQPSRFIMVPVPRALVLDVMRYVYLTATTLDSWDAASIGQLFGAIDELPRRLLTYVAECTVRDEALEFSAAKEALDVRGADLFVAARAACDVAREMNRVQPFGLEVIRPEPGSAGELVRTYMMDGTVADLIIEHVRTTSRKPQ